MIDAKIILANSKDSKLGTLQSVFNRSQINLVMNVHYLNVYYWTLLDRIWVVNHLGLRGDSRVGQTIY